MQSLKEAILYFINGRESFPILSYIDDKERNKKKQKTPPAQFSMKAASIDKEIEQLLQLAESEKRSLCFYPNGYKNKEDIEAISYHFVDIDHGNKDEQFKKIMSFPIKPTIVVRGRAGHKILYKVKEAVWDTSSKEALDKSAVHFKNVQQQLIDYFDGDEKVIAPNSALRLPHTKNYKYWRENVATEEVVYFEPTNVYTQQQIAEAFPPAKVKHKVKKEVSNFAGMPKEKKEAVRLVTEHLDRSELTYTDYGNKLSFQCPVHEDSSPSAYMYKDKLVVHCSSGEADGSCAIGRGKDLKWVAENCGWEDLRECMEKMIHLAESKYDTINLKAMTTAHTIPMDNNAVDSNMIISDVLQEVEDLMQRRGTLLDSKSRVIYTNLLKHMLSSTKGVIVCPLEPGGGKSTLMQVLLKYLLNTNITKAGAVIVVERIETAKQLAESLGEYSTYMDMDVPFWKESSASYVMESPYTSKVCKQNLTDFEYGVCRSCPEKHKCPIPKKYEKQKRHPIVIITHTRLAMDKDKLSNYQKWIDVDGTEYKRELMLIDEKPPLVEVNQLTMGIFDAFLLEIRSLAPDIGIEAVEEAERVITQLRSNIVGVLHEEGIIEPFNPSFSFSFKATWYKKYRGSNVSILRHVEHLIKNGGRVFINQTKQPLISIYETKKYDFSSFNTVILDGTSIIDADYRANQQVQILDIPRVKSYEKLTFCVAPLSFSKSNLNRKPEYIDLLANNIQVFTEKEKVLVLCYKQHEQRLALLLQDEIKKGKVMLNHYGNVKGSNSYSDCTTLVLAGVQHKGDPYYISKYEAIHGEASIISSTIGENKVRRFKEMGLEQVRLNDQLVDIIQDICRVKIRNNNNLSPIKVYIPTKDRVFVNLLKEYFVGSEVEKWTLEETYPEWYSLLRNELLGLPNGEKIRKRVLREKLGLVGSSGKKYFQRLQEKDLFVTLLKELQMVEFNKQTYVRILSS